MLARSDTLRRLPPTRRGPAAARFGLLLGASCLAACAPTLHDRAAQELDCRREQVSITNRGAGLYEARGCGTTLRYVCAHSRYDTTCVREGDPVARERPAAYASSARSEPRSPGPNARRPGGFPVEAAVTAFRVASSFAGHCVPDATKPSDARIRVAFAPDGSPSYVELLAERVDAKTRTCIENAFRHVTVPPFQGDTVVVRKTLRIEPSQIELRTAPASQEGSPVEW